MNNKVLIELVVPRLERSYDIYIPINKRIGNIIVLINKALFQITNDETFNCNHGYLCNAFNNRIYDMNMKIIDTDIRNGAKLVLF